MKCRGYKIEEDYIEIYIKHMFGKVETYLYIKNVNENVEDRIYDTKKKKMTSNTLIYLAYCDFKDKEERNTSKEKLKKIIEHYERKRNE